MWFKVRRRDYNGRKSRSDQKDGDKKKVGKDDVGFGGKTLCLDNRRERE